MTEFQPGDRVTSVPAIPDAVVVGRDPRPDYPNNTVVSSRYGFRSYGDGALTLIPDTVTVTVELTRDQALATAIPMVSAVQAEASRLFRDACAEALS